MLSVNQTERKQHTLLLTKKVYIMRKITSLIASLLMIFTLGANAQEVYTVTYSSNDPEAGSFWRETGGVWSKVTSGFAKRWQSNSDPIVTITATANNYNPADFSFWRGSNRQPNTVTIDTKYRVVRFSITFHNRNTSGGSDSYGPHDQTLIVGTDTVTAHGTETATVSGDFTEEPTASFVFEFADRCANTGAMIDAFVIEYIDNPNLGRDFLTETLANYPFDEAKYPAGDKPGQYPQEMVDAVVDAFYLAIDLDADPEAADADCKAAADAYLAALAALKKAQNPVTVTSGYYYIVSAKNGTAAEPIANVDTLKGLTAMYSSDALYNEFQHGFDASVEGADADPKFIYEVKAVTDSTIKVINLPFQKGLRNVSGHSYITLTDDESLYGEYKVITSGDYPGFAMLRNKNIEVFGDGRDAAYWELYSSSALTNYSLSTNPFINAFRFIPVSQATVDAVKDKIQVLKDSLDQANRNTELNSLINQAQITREKGRTFKVEGGTYDGAFPTESGLITSAEQLASNIQDPGEGSYAGLLDGDYSGSSFFHTSWHSGVGATEHHYIQLDLGEPVQTLLVKFATRSNAGTPDLPYGIKVYGANDAALAAVKTDSVRKVDATTQEPIDYYRLTTVPTESWGDPIMEAQFNWDNALLDGEGNTVSISNGRTSAPINKGAGLVTLEMPEAYRYIRLAVQSTVQSTASGSIRNNGDGFPYWYASELRAYKASLDPNCVYEHMDQDVKNELDAAIAAAKAEAEAKTATQATIDRLEAAIEAFNAAYPDIAKLNAAIEDAQAFADSATVGTQLAQVLEDSYINIIRNAVSSAQAVAAQEVLTFTDYQKALQALEDAIERFGDGVVEPEDGYYFIKSLSSGAPGQNYVAANYSGTQKDEYGRIYWGNKNATDMGDRLNAQWELKKVGKHQFTLRNAATNLYLSNDTTALSMPLYQSAEPYTFKLRFGRYEGAFNLVLDKDLYANASPGAGTIVTWNSARGNDNSAFAFEEVQTFDGTWKLDVKGNGVNIITMPFDASADGDVTYYQVLGQSETTIELEEISGTTIAAGTPFIVAPKDASVTSTNIYTDETSDFAGITYVTDGAKTVNGLVGTLDGAVIDAKYCVMYGDSVVAANSERRQTIAANTGYFDLSTMETVVEGSGAMSLPKSHEVATAIAEVLNDVANKQNGVYTIQGIRLNKTTNLPKGVYIINGRKVVKK